MPDHPIPITPGMRALDYFTEQLWDATRGLITAYRVDTADLAHPDPPEWSDLTRREQLEFMLLTADAARIVRQAATHIAGHERHR